jgi:ribonuclease HI
MEVGLILGSMRSVQVYCDGSGTTWDKCAGYGWVIVVDGAFHSEGSGHIPLGTNNDAEMAAAIKGMIAARALIAKMRDDHSFFNGEIFPFAHPRVEVCSDSQLCLGWMSGRYRNGNPERAKTVAYLQGLFRELGAEAVWVKGHSGHEWNTRADALAHYGRTGQFKLKRDRKKQSDNL